MTVRRAVAQFVAATLLGALFLVVQFGWRVRPDGAVVGRWGMRGAVTSPAAALDPFGVTASAPAGGPTRLRVPVIDVDTSLEVLHTGPDGALGAPADFARAGWYADGSVPGDVGPAVIAGHVDSKRGPAVFFRLRELVAGDTIEVIRGGRPIRFVVTGTAWFSKSAFPSAGVYGPTPDRQLRLITCGGVFDRSSGSYKDNLVVYAVLK